LHDAAMAKASPSMKATFTNRPARNTQCGLSLGNRVPWRERYQLSVTEATGSVVTELVCASGSECCGQFCSQRSEYCRSLNQRKRRFGDVRVPSALPLKADIVRKRRHVSKVPSPEVHMRKPHHPAFAPSATRMPQATDRRMCVATRFH
jgi:hypothetical protein